MYLKLFLNVVLYIFLFVLSSILLSYFESAIVKVLVLLFFLAISVGISLTIYPFPIQQFYQLKINHWGWLVLAILLPVLSVVLVCLNTYYQHYLSNFSFDGSNVLGEIFSQLYVGFTEELFARGLLFYSLFRLTNKFFVAAFISSLVFSLMHGFGNSIVDQTPLFLSYFTIGLVLCMILFLSQSIWPCIAFHFSHNFIMHVVSYDFGVYEKYLTLVSPELFLPYFMPILGAFLLLLFLRFKTFTSEPGSGDHTLGGDHMGSPLRT